MRQTCVSSGIRRAAGVTFPTILALAVSQVGVAQTVFAQTILKTVTSAPALGEAVVSLHTPITVSASVVDSEGNPVTTGTVNFCDALHVRTAQLREPCGPYPLAMAQLTKTGIAVTSLRLPVGPTKVVAIYAGTTTLKGSTSPSTLATVSGQYPTSTSLTYVGPVTGLTLTASVTSPSAFLPGYLSVRNLTSKEPLFSFPGLVTTTYSFRTVGGNVPEGNVLPISTFVVDLNNDGYLDAVALNNNLPGGIELYFNEGGRGLTRPKQGPALQLDGYSQYLAMGVGDFNSDDAVDLVAYNSYSNMLDIFYNDGKGSFPQTPSLQISLASINIENTIGTLYVADFNEDGTLDIAFDPGGEVVVFPNNGDGTFGQPILSSDGTTLGDGGEAGKLLVSSKDQHTDIAMPAADLDLFLLKGNGNGTFTSTEYKPNGLYDLSIAVLDMNEDGYDDVILGSTPSTSADNPMPGGYPSVFYSDGNGHLGGGVQPVLPTVALAIQALPYGLLVTDNGGDFTLIQPSASETYPQKNFTISPHAIGQMDGFNAPLITMGDFDASGLSGFALLNGQQAGGFAGYNGLQAYAASALSTMTIQQSGFTYAAPQVTLGLYHPAGYATAFESTDSNELTIPGTAK